MRYLTKPQHDVAAVIAACVRSMSNVALRDRFVGQEPFLKSAEEDYGKAGPESRLFEIATTNGVNAALTTDEMGMIYNRTFVKRKYARPIYDAIKKAPTNDMCPLCGQRTVSTLDHYLPWTAHPALAVTPINLIPACAECNKLKMAFVPKDASEQLLHPYYDQLESEQWLFASVLETSPSALLFEVRPPDTSTPLTAQRLKNHFATYELGRLYGAHAAEELLNIKYALEIQTSASDVQIHLHRQYLSRTKLHLNSWSTAAYLAWSESVWFCEGGFK